LCKLGDEVTWRAKHFGIYQKLSSKTTKLKAPFYFQDCMIKGAFSFLMHDHYFEENDGVTVMKDVFAYGVSYGFFGILFNKVVLKKYMIALLTERNRVIKEVAEKNLDIRAIGFQEPLVPLYREGISLYKSQKLHSSLRSE